MRLLLAILLVVALSGCVNNSAGQGQQFSASDEHTVTFGGQGQWFGSAEIERKSIECDGDGHFTAGAQGQGSISIRLTDGNGDEIAGVTLNGQGQDGVDRAVTGANGTWIVAVSTASDAFGFGGYQGQYGGSVRC